MNLEEQGAPELMQLSLSTQSNEQFKLNITESDWGMNFRDYRDCRLGLCV